MLVHVVFAVIMGFMFVLYKCVHVQYTQYNNVNVLWALYWYWYGHTTLVITGYYANLTVSVKLIPWPGGPKSYLWQPVIASPVIQPRMKEPQTAVSSWLGLISVAY